MVRHSLSFGHMLNTRQCKIIISWEISVIYTTKVWGKGNIAVSTHSTYKEWKARYETLVSLNVTYIWEKARKLCPDSYVCVTFVCYQKCDYFDVFDPIQLLVYIDHIAALAVFVFMNYVRKMWN